VGLLFAVALTAAQTYYEAKVTSFGCTSIEVVKELQDIRSDQTAFQAALLQKQMYGECVMVLKGTIVQGSVEASDSSILRLNQQIEPPGYEAPRDDFEIKARADRVPDAAPTLAQPAPTLMPNAAIRQETMPDEAPKLLPLPTPAQPVARPAPDAANPQGTVPDEAPILQPLPMPPMATNP
jgi:hypothetical protein